MTKQIWYIHGAHSSPTSFNYLKLRLNAHVAVDVTFDSHEPINETVKKLQSIFAKAPNEIRIIGHSLGGVLAVKMSQVFPTKISHVVSISAPFGGSELAHRARLLYPFNTFLKNVSSGNPLFERVCAKGAVVPTLSLISTSGYNVQEPRPNDGIITVDSQSKLRNDTKVTFELNHFEILVEEKAIDIINKFVDI